MFNNDDIPGFSAALDKTLAEMKDMPADEFFKMYLPKVRDTTMFTTAQEKANLLLANHHARNGVKTLFMSRYGIVEIPPALYQEFWNVVTLDHNNPEGLYVIRFDAGGAYYGAANRDRFTQPCGAVVGTYDEAVMVALMLEPVARIYNDWKNEKYTDDELLDVVCIEFISPFFEKEPSMTADEGLQELDEFFRTREFHAGAAYALTGLDCYEDSEASVIKFGNNGGVNVVLDHDLDLHFVHYGQDICFKAVTEVRAVQIAYFVYLTMNGEMEEDDMISFCEKLSENV